MTRVMSTPVARGRKQSRRTVWLVAVAFLFFIIWSAFAPLEIIVRGNGRVVPSMNTQVLQNLEGGIIQQVFVVEGDEVDIDQRVVQMDATQFESAHTELTEQRLALLIKLQRLGAEQNLREDFVPNQEFVQESPRYAASEVAIFEARREELLSNLTALQEMARLRRSEVDLLQPMAQQSAVPEIEVIRAEQAAVEAEGRVLTLQAEFEARRSEQYSETLLTLGQIEQQINARRDQLDRTDIRSPVRGIVNRVFITTVGGVVNSGDPLVEILPLDQPLRIEGKIDPKDIGSVFSGMEASIKLSAFDYAIYGALRGVVVHVGADTVVETEPNALPYYEVFIELEQTYLTGPDGRVEIRPGMLATVELEAGRRTVLQYFLKPLFRSSEALRER